MTKPERWRMSNAEFEARFGAEPVIMDDAARIYVEALKDEATRARSGEEQAGREWDEWREHFKDVLCGFAFDLGGRARMGFVPCAHCGWRSEIIPEAEINAAIREHIKTCPEHPMRALEAERDEARRERDAAQAVAKEAARQLGEAGAAKLKAECERDVAQAEVVKLGTQIDRMRQRIQELEEHHG